MTVAHLRLDADPVAHGFHAGYKNRHPAILLGRDPAHARALRDWQAYIAGQARTWLAVVTGNWPHYNQPVAVAQVFHLRRPTTYHNNEMWHRTNRPGDLTTLHRAVEDALAGVLYANDAQVCWQLNAKPVIHRDVASYVDVWVGGVDDIPTLAAKVNARLPVNQQAHPGTAGPTRNPALLPPVISDAHAPRAIGAYRDCQVPLQETPSGWPFVSGEGG